MQLPEPGRQPPEDNILPLINIIFLLLIFFMLAGQMVPPGVLSAEPPESQRGLELEQAATLTIAADGRLAWNGELIAARVLTSRAAEWSGERLVVRADGDLESGELMPILRRLRQAGIEDVTLITRRVP
jgi:biopolymer transport protein ExbD